MKTDGATIANNAEREPEAYTAFPLLLLKAIKSLETQVRRKDR